MATEESGGDTRSGEESFSTSFFNKEECVIGFQRGPWSFNRNLIILERVFGDEQPFGIEMHFESFWIRVYNLPLKLRSEVMAKQLGKIIGEYEEVDPKEANRMDMFLRIKVKIDLRKPLKGGTVIKYHEKTKVFLQI